MRNNSLTCSQITKLLRRFQEDLLLEDEYQAFLSHVEGCEKCKKYVHSVGSISNHLWELGNVKVPSHLASAIAFKLEHVPEQEVQPPKFFVSTKVLIIVLVSFLPLSGMVWGMKCLFDSRIAKNSGRNQEMAVSSLPETSEPLIDEVGEVEAKIPQLPVVAGNEVQEVAPTEVYMAGDAAVTENPSRPVKMVFKEIKPLHWHLKFFEGSPPSQNNGRALQITREIQERTALLLKVTDEIKLLKSTDQSGFGRHYSEKTRQQVSAGEDQKEGMIYQKILQKEEIEKTLKRLRVEKEQISGDWQQNLAEIKRNIAQQQTQVRNVLNVLNIQKDYDKNGILIFSASGEQVEKVLEQILFISKNRADFHDFTSEVPAEFGEDYPVFLFWGSQNVTTLHWHLDPDTPAQAARLMKLVAGLSSAVEYQSPRAVVCTISLPQVEALRQSIQAMRVLIEEYGSYQPEKNILVSKPVTLFIYFTR